jgi:hypothetical protein
LSLSERALHRSNLLRSQLRIGAGKYLERFFARAPGPGGGSHVKFDGVVGLVDGLDLVSRLDGRGEDPAHGSGEVAL